MSEQTYSGASEKPLVWLHGEVRTPLFSRAARIEVGTLLRRLQLGESLGLPESRPLPILGSRCHELRVRDENRSWRLIYRLDDDAIVIAEVFAKTTRTTPHRVLRVCARRFRAYDEATRAPEEG